MSHSRLEEIEFASSLIHEHYLHCRSFVLGIAEELRGLVADPRPGSSLPPIDGTPTGSSGAPCASWAESPALNAALVRQLGVDPARIFGAVASPSKDPLFRRTRDHDDERGVGDVGAHDVYETSSEMSCD